MSTAERRVFRCAIYTRKSTEHNLDLEFNSLDAQREACEADMAMCSSPFQLHIEGAVRLAPAQSLRPGIRASNLAGANADFDQAPYLTCNNNAWNGSVPQKCWSDDHKAPGLTLSWALIGTCADRWDRQDDASDAVDLRVEFKVVRCRSANSTAPTPLRP
jgi:hypothetical protein